MKLNRKNIFGTTGIYILTVFSCFWAFWGIIENFYEGWYYHSFWMNLAMMLRQYMAPLIIFYVCGFLAVYYRRWGVVFLLIIGILVSYYYHNWFFFLPFLPSAILLWFGEIKNKRWTLRIHLFLPIVILLIFGIGPAYRVATRNKQHIDSAFNCQLSSSKTLVWAPTGPGWPDTYYNWIEADSICKRLTNDGLGISDSILNIWRLPSAEEAVLSMQRHGKSAGGRWDSIQKKESYNILPDKEAPLWRHYSPIIYWWTSTKEDSIKAYMISANGVVKPVNMKHKAGYYGFRAVKGN